MNLVLLHGLSIAGSFLFTFGGLFFLQKYTLGKLSFFKKMKYEDGLFALTSLLFIWQFVTFTSPWQ